VKARRKAELRRYGNALAGRFLSADCDSYDPSDDLTEEEDDFVREHIRRIAARLPAVGPTPGEGAE